MFSFSFYRLSIAAHLIQDNSFAFTSPCPLPFFVLSFIPFSSSYSFTFSFIFSRFCSFLDLIFPLHFLALSRPSLCPHASLPNLFLLLLHPSLSPFPRSSFLSLSSASASSYSPSVTSHRSPSIYRYSSSPVSSYLLPLLLLIPFIPNLTKQKRERPNSTIFCFVIIHL